MGNCFGTRVNNHQSAAPTERLTPEGSRNNTRNYNKQQVNGGEIISSPRSNAIPIPHGKVVQGEAISRNNKTGVYGNKEQGGAGGSSNGSKSINTCTVPTPKMFTLSELKAATRNFRPDTMIGEGGFGRVFKGWVDERTYAPSRAGVGMVVAVKKSSPDSSQGLREWHAEVKFLGKFSHPNLVKLLGFCWEEEQFLLVYEYMQKGSLEGHLFRNVAEPLSWELRLKIAVGAAKGLAFLHTSEKSVIYRDFKTSNILLDSEYNAKLSDFGLAKLGPINGNSHVTTRILGTYGYAAPEYVATGHLYVKSDVYGFGVVLLELLTGLRALDTDRPSREQNLVEWAKPSLSDKKKLKKLMDPRLEDKYPSKAAIQIAQLVLQCLESDPRSRPSMEEVLDTLTRASAMGLGAKTPETKVKAKAHIPDARLAHRNYNSHQKSPLHSRRGRPINTIRTQPPLARSVL